MSNSPLPFLKHIRDECQYLRSVKESVPDYKDFIADETLKRASVRSIEIIGEASKKIPADFKLKWKTVDWRAIAGMRDRLIHDYMGVDFQIVWDVIQEKIPELLTAIEQILEQEDRDTSTEG